MFLAIILLLIFAFFAGLMYLNKLPALIALPLMAVLIGLFSGMPLKDIAAYIVSDGAVRLNLAIVTVLFGSMLSQFVGNSGIAESLIKKVAELSGDSPFRVCFIMTIVVALLFTVLGGLGSVIMVASIVFPIMLSIGVLPLTAGCLFLLGLSFGGLFNLANWQLYISVLGLSQAQILGFAGILGLIFLAVLCVFLLIEVGAIFDLKKSLMNAAVIVLAFIALYAAYAYGAVALLYPFIKSLLFNPFAKYLFILAGAAFAAAFIYDTARSIINIVKGGEDRKHVSFYAILTPVAPIILILGFAVYNLIYKPQSAFDFPIITAIAAGILWGFLSTLKKGSINILSKSVFEGIGSVGPAVALIMGIGMVLNAVTHPAVTGVISPLILRVIPSNPVYYVVFFAVLAPLALYRGPLNIWGMGAGLVGLLLSAKTMPVAAIMAALMSVGQIQGVCDPTNTHNVWIANNLSLNVQDILKKTIGYMWILALLGLIAAGVLYF
ncbi:MAG: citrate transporter [Candidatus Margulisiibacteriota bacterium]